MAIDQAGAVMPIYDIDGGVGREKAIDPWRAQSLAAEWLLEIDARTTRGEIYITAAQKLSMFYS